MVQDNHKRRYFQFQISLIFFLQSIPLIYISVKSFYIQMSTTISKFVSKVYPGVAKTSSSLNWTGLDWDSAFTLAISLVNHLYSYMPSTQQISSLEELLRNYFWSSSLASSLTRATPFLLDCLTLIGQGWVDEVSDGKDNRVFRQLTGSPEAVDVEKERASRPGEG